MQGRLASLVDGQQGVALAVELREHPDVSEPSRLQDPLGRSLQHLLDPGTRFGRSGDRRFRRRRLAPVRRQQLDKVAGFSGRGSGSGQSVLEVTNP